MKTIARHRPSTPAGAGVSPDAEAATRGPALDRLAQRLLDTFQRGVPVCERPFAAMGATLGVSEAAVLDALQRLDAHGVLSRVGPVFRAGAIGASTLAAMAVPAADLERVAELVNGYGEVNHNYEREHPFNLWFVLTAENEARLAEVLRDIEQRTGLEVLRLPLEEAYHIDLGFALGGERAQ